MSKVYKIITVIFFISSILIGALWAHTDELININISNITKSISKIKNQMFIIFHEIEGNRIQIKAIQQL